MLNKLKTYLLVAMVLFSSKAMACPYFVASVQGAEDDYTVYALMAFVAFTYVPGFFIYRLIKKTKKIESKFTTGSKIEPS